MTNADDLCLVCGLPLPIGWLGCINRVREHEPGFANVIGDEIDETHENLGDKPVSFRSREEKRRYLKEHRIYDATRHVGAPGSDKSKETTRWI